MSKIDIEILRLFCRFSSSWQIFQTFSTFEHNVIWKEPHRIHMSSSVFQLFHLPLIFRTLYSMFLSLFVNFYLLGEMINLFTSLFAFKNNIINGFCWNYRRLQRHRLFYWGTLKPSLFFYELALACFNGHIHFHFCLFNVTLRICLAQNTIIVNAMARSLSSFRVKYMIEIDFHLHEFPNSLLREYSAKLFLKLEYVEYPLHIGRSAFFVILWSY